MCFNRQAYTFITLVYHSRHEKVLWKYKIMYKIQSKNCSKHHHSDVALDDPSRQMMARSLHFLGDFITDNFW